MPLSWQEKKSRSAIHGSFAVHPLPGECASERKPDHEQGQGPENSHIEVPIEPATDENADQCRCYDGPAECTDHRQVLAERALALALPACAPLLARPDRFIERIAI